MRFEDVAIGTVLGPERMAVSREQAVRYAKAWAAGASRFTDDEAARMEGLPGAILPGNMSLGLLTRFVTDWIGGSGARLVRMGTTYRVPVQPEQTLVLQGLVTHTYPEQRRCEIELWIENEDAERLVTATATVEFAN